jgi:plasmid stabilization system protein ParE
MAYKIIQSQLFLKQVIALNTWLEENWGLQVAVNFKSNLDNTVLLIASKPGIGRASKKNDKIKSKLITKRNRLYYRIEKDKTITLLTLFDTRQHPQKNKYE